MSKAELHRLGDYIREVDVRNTDESISNLVGLTIAKSFIPSVANTIGTDLSKYKVIKEKQFACSLMQVSRDGKMPVAMFSGEPSIMSPAYPMFEIVGNDLMPEYLQLWFLRPEFDREATFYAVGGVRGSLDWDDFIDMKIPVPSIEDQRKIVNQYNAIQSRIELNKQTISKLEDAAQAIYNNFITNNESDSKVYALTDLALVQYGFAFSGELFNTDGIGMPIVRIRNIPTGKTFDFTTESAEDKYLVNFGDILVGMDGDFHINRWIGEQAYLVQRSCLIKPYNKALTGLVMQSLFEPIRKFGEMAVGATVNHLSKKDFDSITIRVPNDNISIALNEIREHIHLLGAENSRLEQIALI